MSALKQRHDVLSADGAEQIRHEDSVLITRPVGLPSVAADQGDAVGHPGARDVPARDIDHRGEVEDSRG
jgi:hypothetical protein